MAAPAHWYAMNANLLPLRLAAASVLAACAFSTVSCTTTYDAYGRPVETVDPGAAVVGAAAAGVAGYAIGRSHDDNHHHYYNDSYRHRNHGYYGGRTYYRRHHY